MIDIQQYYAKLARRESISEEEVVALLKELAYFRNSVAYLASCQASTLQSLPKSSSKSQRARHVSLCNTAAQMLIGEYGMSHNTDLDATRDRCLRAVQNHSAN